MPCTYLVTSYVTAYELFAICMYDIERAINVVEDIRTKWQTGIITTEQAMEALMDGRGYLHIDAHVMGRVRDDLILLEDHPLLTHALTTDMAKLQKITNDFRNYDLNGCQRKNRRQAKKNTVPAAVPANSELIQEPIHCTPLAK